eukprot:110907-Rhodomonas_salina.1
MSTNSTDCGDQFFGMDEVWQAVMVGMSFGISGLFLLGIMFFTLTKGFKRITSTWEHLNKDADDENSMNRAQQMGMGQNPMGMPPSMMGMPPMMGMQQQQQQPDGMMQAGGGMSNMGGGGMQQQPLPQQNNGYTLPQQQQGMQPMGSMQARFIPPIPTTTSAFTPRYIPCKSI